ncbi:MAG: helix-turn-helix domain-containing protein [Planctomycetes bacterium]|nr:helix-turn-helix domain-containing protein [Planctomycetota bacterium]
MKPNPLLHLSESRVMAENYPELAAVGIQWVGITQVRGPRTRTSFDEDRKHSHLHIAAVGRPLVLIDKRWVELPDGTAYVNPLGSEWGWRYEGNTNESQQHLFVRFINGSDGGVPRGKRHSYLQPDCVIDDLLWTYRQLQRECVSAGRSTVIRCLAELIAFHAHEMIHPTEPTSQLAELWMAVSADLTRAWTLDDLCEEAAMSAEKLRLVCQRELGSSPMRHVTDLRMRKAADLLRTTDWSIARVGVAVGYPNPFNFSVAFKRRHNLSPREYCKRLASRRAMHS